MNVRDDEDIRQLALLDPARDREPTVQEWTRARNQVDRVLAGQHGGTHASVHRAWPRRLAVGFAAAAVAAGGAVALPALLPGPTDKAIASWTPQPGSLTGEQVLPQAKACAEQGVGGAAGAPVSASDVVLAERRGTATLLLLKRGTGVIECMMVGKDDVFASMTLTDGPLAPPKNGVIGVMTSSSVGEGDSQYSNAVGSVDPSVTSVELILDSGKTIQASTKSGWWAAWWPGPEGGEVNTFRVVVHTAAATTTYRPSDLYT